MPIGFVVILVTIQTCYAKNLSDGSLIRKSFPQETTTYEPTEMKLTIRYSNETRYPGNRKMRVDFCDTKSIGVNSWKGIQKRRMHSTNSHGMFQSTKQSPIPFPQLSEANRYQNDKNINKVVDFLKRESKLHKKRDRYNGGNTKVKFSGVYLYPRKSDNINIIQSAIPTPFKKTMNGHAYNSDPLMPYKPSQPGDINLLATRQFRFAPTSNNHPQTNQINDKGFITNVKPSLIYNHVKPFGNVKPSILNSNHAMPFGSVKDSSSQFHDENMAQKRPFSIMLDLYPMNDDVEGFTRVPDHLRTPLYNNVPSQPYTSRPAVSYPSQYTGNYLYSANYPYGSHNPYFNSYHDQRNSRGSSKEYPFKHSDKNFDSNPMQMLVYLNVYPQKKY